MLPMNNAYATSTYDYETLSDGDAWALEPMTLPNAVYNGTTDKTFFAYSELVGTLGVGNYYQSYKIRYYDHVTDTLSSEYEVGNTDDLTSGTGNGQSMDSHAAPSIGILWNGSLIVFYHAHGLLARLRYRVSVNAFDHDTWYSEIENLDAAFTYPQVISYPNVLYLFIRQTVGSFQSSWHRYTFNSGGVWQDDTLIIDDPGSYSYTFIAGMYATFSKEPNSDYILMSATWSPGNSTTRREDVYFAKSTDKGVTWKEADGSSLSLPLGGVGLVNKNDMKIASLPTYYTTTTHAHINNAGNPSIITVWGVIGGSASQPTGLYHSVWTGSTWDSGFIHDQDNVNLTRASLDPTNFGIHGFRDAQFNRTTIYWNNPTEMIINRYVVGETESDHVFTKTHGFSDMPLVSTTPIHAFATQGGAKYPWEAFIFTAKSGVGYFNYYVYNYASYLFTFKSKYNEDDGSRYASDRETDVTAFYSDGTASETFTVNGTYYFGSASAPLYFSEAIDSITREYWVDSETSATIYIFNSTSTLTDFTVKFIDVQGILADYPFITLKRYVNGTLFTIEKRKADIDNKILVYLVSGVKYSIYVSSYVFGDYLFTGDGTDVIQLNLRNIGIPENLILTYQYITLYQVRDNTTITTDYVDSTGLTTSVTIVTYNATDNTVDDTHVETSNDFTYNWASADSEQNYYSITTIVHSTYGTLTKRTYLPCLNSLYGNPWDLSFLWASAPNATMPLMLVGTMIILACAMAFSQVHAGIGALITCFVAALLTWMGWMPIPLTGLVTAFGFAALIFIANKKRGD